MPTTALSPILGADGVPIRKVVSKQKPGDGYAPVRAKYDAAGQSNEFSLYWANADALDADSANSRTIRHRIMSRARYEVDNNGFVDGMALAHADYLVGLGPKLRMQTNNTSFNELVEAQWQSWAKAVQLRRKLWVMAHAKTQDGESFAVVRNNPAVGHPVQIDMVLFEAEQCQSPNIPFGMTGYVDGIRFDAFGNPVYYDVLPYHPGGQWSAVTSTPEQIPAKYVMHWFQMRRPGQHRGISELKSTLNCGASSRRWREAILAAAESAAEINLVLKTQLNPSIDLDYEGFAAFSTQPINRRMMTALPEGYDFGQVDSKHPNAQYAEFHRAQIMEQGRSLGMPVNVATGDSSKHNFASGKLDHLPWHQRMTVERSDGDDTVLSPLFNLFFQELALVYGFANRITPAHVWDWPVLPIADEKARANANATKLANGETTPSKVWSENGDDFSEGIVQMADDYGVPVEEMKAILRDKIFNRQQQQPEAPPDDE